MMRGVLLVVLLPLLGGGFRPAHGSEAATPQPPTLQQFFQRVWQYVELHRQVEQLQPPPRKTDNADEINARRHALADGLRRSRPEANPGDIFTPPAAAHFRRIIRADLQQTGATVVDAVPTDQPAVALRVNDEYPTHEPLTTVPPLLLRQLPPLPEELEYRFVGQHLLLIDRKANLIVDFLRYAVDR